MGKKSNASGPAQPNVNSQAQAKKTSKRFVEQINALNDEARTLFNNNEIQACVKKYIELLQVIETIPAEDKPHVDGLNKSIANAYIRLGGCYLGLGKIDKAKKARDRAINFKFFNDQRNYLSAKIHQAENEKLPHALCVDLLTDLCHEETLRKPAELILMLLWEDFNETGRTHFDSAAVSYILTSPVFRDDIKTLIAHYADDVLHQTELAIDALTVIDSAAANTYLATIYYRQKRFEQAIKSAKKVINSPDAAPLTKAEAYYYLALIIDDTAASEAEHRLALDYYQTAIELGFVAANHNLGYKLVYGQGVDPEPERGFACLQSALAHTSSNGLTLTELGICFRLGLGATANLAQAEQHLHRAYTQHLSAKAGHHLALVYRDQHRIDEALELLATLLEQQDYNYCLPDAIDLAVTHGKSDYVTRFDTKSLDLINVLSEQPRLPMAQTENLFSLMPLTGIDENSQRQFHYLRYRVLSIKKESSPFRQSQRLLELMNDGYAKTIGTTMFLLASLAELYHQHANIRGQIYRQLPQINALIKFVVNRIDTISIDFLLEMMQSLSQLHIRQTTGMCITTAWDNVITVLSNIPALTDEEKVKLVSILSHTNASAHQRERVIAIFMTIRFNALTLPLAIEACYRLAVIDHCARQAAQATVLDNPDLRRQISSLLFRILNNEALQTINAQDQFKHRHFAFIASQYFMNIDTAFDASFSLQFSQSEFNVDTPALPGHPSQLQQDVASVLARYCTGSGLQEEQVVGGYRIDFQWVTADSIILVEVDGPSHFLMGQHYGDCEPTPKDRLREFIVRHIQQEKFNDKQVIMIRIPYYRWPSDANLASKKAYLETVFSAAGIALQEQDRSQLWHTVVGGKNRIDPQKQQSVDSIRPTPRR